MKRRTDDPGKPRRSASRRDADPLLRGSIAPEVIDHILSSGQKPFQSGARVPLAVLFADLRGFTSLSARLKAELVVRLLNDFFSVMTDLAVANRATIDRLIGDAIMLLYGLPQPSPDDPARAVRTAVEMQRAFLGLHNTWLRDARRRAAGVGLGVGIATGQVVIANVGSSVRMDHTAIGAPINRAAHLCAAARDGEVLIDGATHDAVASSLRGEVAFSPIDVGPKGKPLSAYRCQLKRPRLHLVTRRGRKEPV